MPLWKIFRFRHTCGEGLNSTDELCPVLMHLCCCRQVLSRRAHPVVPARRRPLACSPFPAAVAPTAALRADPTAATDPLSLPSSTSQVCVWCSGLLNARVAITVMSAAQASKWHSASAYHQEIAHLNTDVSSAVCCPPQAP